MGKRLVSNGYPAGRTRPTSSTVLSQNLASPSRQQLRRHIFPPANRRGRRISGIAELAISRGIGGTLHDFFANSTERLGHFLNLDFRDATLVIEVRDNDDSYKSVVRINVPDTNTTCSVTAFRLNRVICIDQTSQSDPVSTQP